MNSFCIPEYAYYSCQCGTRKSTQAKQTLWLSDIQAMRGSVSTSKDREKDVANALYNELLCCPGGVKLENF